MSEQQKKRTWEKFFPSKGKSLTAKLLSFFLFTLLLSLTISYILHTVFFQPYYLKMYEKRMLSIYDSIEAELDSEYFLDIIIDLDYSQQVDIVIADRNLRYAVRSHERGSSVTEQRLDMDFHNLITYEYETLQSSYLCEPLLTDSQPPRLVFIKKLSNEKYCILTHPWENLETNMEDITEFHFLVAAVACGVGILATLIFSRRFTKPIIEISKATEGLSQLDFQQKITYTSQDELGHLAHSINTLSNKLNENRTALKNEIAFQKVLSQNMSHELKTPISVMKGYVEGVYHGIANTEEVRQEYLEIVLEECDRMTILIDRMLHLSKLTSFQEQGLENDFFSALTFKGNIQSHCGVLLQQNNLTLEEEEQESSDLPFYGNLELLVQGFGNFISNAVKYGDKNILRLSLSQEEDYQYFSLYNSGNLVPEEEMTRIFNVFYMVDKARSREGNSHGLGLAVIKTIAELHHGEAYCTQEVDGMVFTLKIPTSSKLEKDGG